MTIYSQGGLSFALINAIGNFGAVFVDQSYFTAAVAASSSASWKSYLLAGALWFSIPFSIATAVGLAARATALPLSGKEASEGLVAPAVAHHFLGNSGSFLVAVIILFSTATTAQQELIAVSKIISYDLYKTYINIKATDVQILKVTRIAILCFGLFMGLLGIILSTFGVTLEFVYLFMGIAIGGAAAPIYFCLNWDKASAKGAIAGVIAGTSL
jgi:Na+/proline symporter